MKQLFSSLKILVIIVITLFSCNKKKSLKIHDASLFLTDSLILGEKNQKIKSWNINNDNYHKILIGDKLFNLNLLEKKIDSIENKFDRRANKILEIAENSFYDRSSKIANLIIKEKDSLKYYPFLTNYLSLNNDTFILQINSYHTLVKLENKSFLAPLLYKEFNPTKTVLEYQKNCNKNRLGFFEIESDRIVLKKTFDINPRKDFLRNDKRYLFLIPYMCQSKSDFYFTYNFIDSIYNFDFNGKLIGSISLPKELGFKYYNIKDFGEMNSYEFSISEMTGFKNLNIYKNITQNKLLITTLEGLDQNKKYEVTPAFDDLNWFASVYDIDNKEWVKIMKFDKNHDFRNVIFDGNFIYVKRNNSTNLIFDKYEY